MRNCIPEETLQAWFDGELAANEAGTVAAHLNGCLNCAEVARTVEAENLMVSRSLATEFEVTIPTERMRERLGTAVAAFHQGSKPPVRRSFSYTAREFFASFRPLAYASIVAAVLIAVAVVFLSWKKESAAPAPEIARNDSGGGPSAIATPPTKPPSEGVGLPVKDKKNVVRFKAKSQRRQSEPSALSVSWQQRQYDYAIARLDEAIKIQPAMPASAQFEYAYDMALIDHAIASGRAAAILKIRRPLNPCWPLTKAKLI
jgi:hypothetical protein